MCKMLQDVAVWVVLWRKGCDTLQDTSVVVASTLISDLQPGSEVVTITAVLLMRLMMRLMMRLLMVLVLDEEG
jgi:hypothetical protein